MSLFSGSQVIELTPKNFIGDKIVHPKLTGNTKGLIFFGASWCGYSKKSAPEYIKASNMLGKAFPLFSLDCVKYSELAGKLQVKSYPTIKFINKNGTIGKNYTSDRESMAFLAGVCKESLVCK